MNFLERAAQLRQKRMLESEPVQVLSLPTMDNDYNNESEPTIKSGTLSTMDNSPKPSQPVQIRRTVSPAQPNYNKLLAEYFLKCRNKALNGAEWFKIEYHNNEIRYMKFSNLEELTHYLQILLKTQPKRRQVFQISEIDIKDGRIIREHQAIEFDAKNPNIKLFLNQNYN